MDVCFLSQSSHNPTIFLDANNICIFIVKFINLFMCLVRFVLRNFFSKRTVIQFMNLLKFRRCFCNFIRLIPYSYPLFNKKFPFKSSRWANKSRATGKQAITNAGIPYENRSTKVGIHTAALSPATVKLLRNG